MFVFANMADSTRKCSYCDHSRAAHTDGVHCALCRCRSEEPAVVQESFAFRGAVASRRHQSTRKR